MPKNSKIKFSPIISKFKRGLGSLALILVKKAFLTAISFLLLGLILSGLIFYQYVISSQRELLIPEESFQFNEQEYLKILGLEQQLEEGPELLDFNPFEAKD